jgi:PKD domain/Matrixin
VLAAVSFAVGVAPAHGYVLHPYAWERHHATYYNAAKRYAPEVRAAVRAWNSSGARFRWVPGPRRGSDVTIRLGKLPVTVPGATRTLFEVRSGRLLQATIVLRPDLLHPNWPPRGARYFATLAVAHELGHALGLGHETRTCATMNPVFPLSCPRPKQPWRFHCRLLHADDVRGAIRRYGGRMRALGPSVCDVSPQPPPASGLVVEGGSRPVVSWHDPAGGRLRRVLLRRRNVCPTGVGDRSATVIADDRATGGPVSITDAAVPGDGQYCYAVVVLDAWQHPSRLATAWYTQVSPAATAFSWTADAGNAHRVVFTDGSTDAGGRIVSWHWDFGDGASSTDQSPAHIYASGTYTVALTVTDDRGQTATTSQRVTVGG